LSIGQGHDLKLGFESNARTYDFTFAIKASIMDLAYEASARTKDLTFVMVCLWLQDRIPGEVLRGGLGLGDVISVLHGYMFGARCK